MKLRYARFSNTQHFPNLTKSAPVEVVPSENLLLPRRQSLDREIKQTSPIPNLQKSIFHEQLTIPYSTILIIFSLNRAGSMDGIEKTRSIHKMEVTLEIHAELVRHLLRRRM
jgi:hypothetical protein